MDDLPVMAGSTSPQQSPDSHHMQEPITAPSSTVPEKPIAAASLGPDRMETPMLTGTMAAPTDLRESESKKADPEKMDLKDTDAEDKDGEEWVTEDEDDEDDEELSGVPAAMPYPYQPGALLRLRRVRDSSQITVKIQKPMDKRTLSCGMTVGIEEGPDDTDHYKDKLVFLKMFDWRFSSQARDNVGALPFTRLDRKMYTEMIMADKMDGFFDQIRPVRGRWDKCSSNWTCTEYEAAMALDMQEYYHSEMSVYARLLDLQGVCIPQFFAAVELDITPKGIRPNKQQRKHFQVSGILLQYIPGVPLSEVTNYPLQAPGATHKDIVDTAIRLVSAVSDRNVINGDCNTRNFIVPLEMDKEQKLVCKPFQIDFGLARVRGWNETWPQWCRAKWSADEEGTIARDMQPRLERIGIKYPYQRSLRYCEHAPVDERNKALRLVLGSD